MKTKLLMLFLFLTITLQAQTNLVPNGNFENWTSSSQPDNWFRSFNGLVFQSTSAQNGSSSTKMQITSGTFNFINSEFFPVVAGKTYRVTMYHKLVTGTFSAIELSLYHKPGTFKTEITKKTDGVTSSTEWRKIEFDYTPTANQSIEVDIWTTGTLNSEILVDNVSVVDVATLGPQYTLIPDLNFEKKLIALGYDSGTPDGKVLTSNIKAVTSLTLDAKTIADLTGIEDFVALKTLRCTGNSGSPIGGNGLLTKIDVSNNSVLTSLDISYNKIKSIDISKNVLLNYLNVSVNGMTGLDVSNNVALTNLDCSTNQLTTLDISKNVALTNLDSDSNQLTTLDLSKNVALTTFYCSSNQLTSLNLKNGKNTLITTNSINLVNNPNLKCILVDDETYANANWSTKKDATASFNATDCTPYTLIPDERFEDTLILLNIDTDGKNGKVKTASIESLTDLSIINAGIKDLTGIQDFKSLKSLVCNANELTTIDLSKNIALTELYCNNNLITTLDVSNNVNLSYLDCFDNQIAVLNLSKNVLLKTLSARNNKIASLDLSKNVLLETLICKDNVLTSLNLKNGKNTILSMLDTRNNSGLYCILVDDVAYAVDNFKQKDATADYSLNCSSTVIYTTIPDVKFEEKLITLGIDNDGKNGKVKTTSIEYLKSINLQIAEIKDLTGIQDFKNLEFLDCGYNSLTQLNVTQNVKLTELYCHFNKLTVLDVSNNILLTIIQANKNSLQKFDVSANKVLADLNVKDNLLTTLNLKNGYNNKALYYLTKGNPNLSCIQVDSKTFADDNWSSSKDATASYSESCANLSTSDVIFEKLNVYPNPTKGALFIDNVSVNKVVAYDALGKLLNVPFSTNGTSTSANLEQFPKGIYYMYIESDGETTVRKVIVE